MALGTLLGKLLVKSGLLQLGCECCEPTKCTLGIRIKAPPRWVAAGLTAERTLSVTRDCNLRTAVEFSAVAISLSRQESVRLFYEDGEWYARVSVAYAGCPAFAFRFRTYTSGPLAQGPDGIFSEQTLTLEDFTITGSTVPEECECYEVYSETQFNVCDNNFPSLLQLIR